MEKRIERLTTILRREARELITDGPATLDPMQCGALMLTAAEMLDWQAIDIAHLQPVADVDDGEPAEMPHGAPARKRRAHPVDRHIERASKVTAPARATSPRFDGPCIEGRKRHKPKDGGNRACAHCGKLPKGSAPSSAEERTLPMPTGKVHYSTAARRSTPCNLSPSDLPAKEKTAELAAPPITCGACIAQLRHDGAL